MTSVIRDVAENSSTVPHREGILKASNVGLKRVRVRCAGAKKPIMTTALKRDSLKG